MELASKQSFSKGGVLIVSPSLASSGGVAIQGTSTFAIGTGGKVIYPA